MRRIVCDKVKNMRDLGGYLTKEGKITKYNSFYRSDLPKDMSEKEINYLKEAHFKRIELSDLIIVVNKDNYIGDSTKAEIDFAIELGKEVIYYCE